jgi:flagellar motor protein MotB
MKLRFFSLFLVVVSLFASVAASAQDKEAFVRAFNEGNKLMEEGYWFEASKEWKKALKYDANNLNVQYKLGYCLLQTTTKERLESEKYLEKSISKGVSKNYDPFEPTEKKPPVDAYYYLAVSQHLNSKFEASTKSFAKLKQTIPKAHRLVPWANYGLRINEEAVKQIANPKRYTITNAGDIINGPFADFSPVLTFDESSIFFTSRRLRPDSTNSQVRNVETDEYKDDIYQSFRTSDGKWTKPELLNLNTDDNDASISVSPDGLTLFVYQDSIGDGQVKYSKLIGEIWSDPAKIGSDVNSKYWETHVTVSADETELYFVSERPGGQGGRDIYRCVKMPDGKWSKAMNLGKVVNTPYDEDAPFLSPDGQFLYFASRGHNTMGGFDLFISKKGKDGNWGKPENMGYPLNTVFDDIFFQPMADGKRAYYSSLRPDGFGELDIYVVEMPQTNGTQLAVIKGYIIGEEGQPLPEDLKIVITNLKTNDKMEVVPRKKDGRFLSVLLPCTNYHVEYFSGREKIKQEDITIPCDGDYYEIEREVYLLSIVDEAPLQPKIEEIKAVEFDKAKPIQVVVDENIGYAEYSHFFMYGSAGFSSAEPDFKNFMNELEKIMKKKGKVEIFIESSASNVPSKKYKNNIELSKARSTFATDEITKELTARGYKLGEQFTFHEATNLVQGKKYENDKDTKRDEYEKYQYIKIKVL